VVISAPECKKQPAFKILIPNVKTYYLVCLNAQDCQDWLTMLERIRLGKPAVVEKQRKIGPDDFETIRLLGRGTYGRVDLVRHRADGTYYAMKTMNKQALAQFGQVQQTFTERDVLLKTVHPFLVGAHFTFQSDTELFLVLDYVPGGELFQRLKEETMFSEARSRLYGAEILMGLGHLHSLGFIYRDLKPENILLDYGGHLRLTDFGLVKMNLAADTTTSTFCGTPQYMAPEMLERQPYTRSVDWWSFGIILYEMLTGWPPFYNENMRALVRAICNDRVGFPQHVSQDARDLILRLLDKRPELRLGACEYDYQEIQAHPWFAGMDWDAVYNKTTQPEWVPPRRDDEFAIRPDEEDGTPEIMIGFDTETVSGSTQTAFSGFTCVQKSRL
jgi:serine/threonine protein kinase